MTGKRIPVPAISPHFPRLSAPRMTPRFANRSVAGNATWGRRVSLVPEIQSVHVFPYPGIDQRAAPQAGCLSLGHENVAI